MEVLAISTDTVFSHKVWHQTSDLIKPVKFPILSDSKNVGRNVSELIRQIKAFQCVRRNPAEIVPAGWQPGKKTFNRILKLPARYIKFGSRGDNCGMFRT